MSEVKRLSEYINANINSYYLLDLILSKYQLSDKRWVLEQINYVKEQNREQAKINKNKNFINKVLQQFERSK